MLDTEYTYYLKNQKELLKQYSNKVLVIRGETVVGVFDDEVTAYKDSVSKYGLGNFLMQKCLPEKEAVQTFYSNVVFT